MVDSNGFNEWFNIIHRTINESKQSCRNVRELPPEEQCKFILTNEDCLQQLIPVYKWLFCDFTDALLPLGLTIIILVLISLFIILSSIADACIVPCIATIATVLRMSDTLAGVTVLAFGNGAPDVFTALASKLMGLSQIFYTGIAGGCMFVTTCVAGLVLIIRPFRVDGWSLIRDLAFLLISYFILFTSFAVGVISFQMCFTFIALYIMYISMVLLGQWGSIRYVKMKTLMAKEKKSPELMRTALASQKSIYSKYPILREHRYSKANFVNEALIPEHLPYGRTHDTQDDTIWTQFINSVIPFSIIDWSFMPWHERILSTLQAPVVVILKITIPTCNLQQPLHGWSKLLVFFNLLFCTPLTMYFLSDESHIFGVITVNGIPMYVFISIPGVIAATLILLLTEVQRPPRGHSILAFIGFPIAIILVNFVCNTVVLLLEGLGTKLGISYSTLGMTLLAWGNSLGDLVSNTTLAKNGMPRMGFAACFGAPLFTCIFGAGVTSLVGLVHTNQDETSVILEATGSLVSYFVFASLISSMCTFTLMDMDGRRSYGCFLITLYITFIIMVTIAEFATKK